MWKQLVGFAVVSGLAAMIPMQAEPVREARWAAVEAGQSLPEDLTDPEGRTRWDLTDLRLGEEWTRALETDPAAPGRLRRTDRRPAGETQSEVRLFEDPQGGETAERWLLPDRDPALRDPAWTGPDLLTEWTGERGERLWVETRRVGLGWLHLPAGPHEVVLQRAVVYREAAGGGGLVPDTLLHRWVDPREGVVAEVWGPASRDGLTRLEVGGAAVVIETLVGQLGLRIYADDTDRDVYERLAYGFDRGPVNISVLTPEGYTTVGELVSASSWDFSQTNRSNAIAEIASTTAPVNADETCSWDKCGFNRPGAKLGREDRYFDVPESLDITTSVTEREDRAGDVTLWMRAGINKEGQSGGLGEGESRLCYVDDGRTEVPLWRFSHEDPGVGWYMQLGDTWTHAPFACENNIFNHVCPNSCGLLCPIYAYACTGFSGTQSSAVIAEGPVTLPSGHTFHALVVRKVIEFCASILSNCGWKNDEVRTVIYLWEVSGLGTVAQLKSAQVVADPTSFQAVEQTDIKYGLFPPLSVTATVLDDDSIEISWNPGLDTQRIDEYRVYWDTDSGAVTAYAHSLTQPAAAGTSVVLDGLAPGTEHFFTVTSLSDFTDPASEVVTTYESVIYPASVPADPVPLPVEVSATTTCTPSAEVSGVMVNKTVDGIQICWDASADPCLRSYEVLGADTPEAPENFVALDEIPVPTACTDLDPTQTFFQVRVKGVGATGP